MEHTVYFDGLAEPVRVPSGALLSEAARLAGLEIGQPCGGQGRCGRCTVKILDGAVRRRSALRLSAEDVAAGYALACQTVVEGDVRVYVPPQEKVERRLTTDRTAAEVETPLGYNPDLDQTVRRVRLTLEAPSMEDQTDDLSRLLTALRQQAGLTGVTTPLAIIRKLGRVLRQADWRVTAILDIREGFGGHFLEERLIDVLPGHVSDDEPLLGTAIDIGTTTVTVWLVDLVSGKVAAQASEYNGQIVRGEDVISRIVYASKNGGEGEMRRLVLDTINTLLETVCERANRRRSGETQVSPGDIVKAVVAGNSTMTHLLLGIPAASIRLSPFVTAANHIPLLSGLESGLAIHPLAAVDCLPGVASYVGSDITAGVLSSGMNDTDRITLFMDVGTNGEIVLGSHDWLVTCACSAGPAFEGAGVYRGMRATTGAIEEVWINSATYEPTYRVIGTGPGGTAAKPRGICGSGLISLLAELFMTGVIDKAGHLNTALSTPRIRDGEHGLEYVVAWGAETQDGRDISITHVDIDNLLRAKGAIFAGYTVLAQSVGVPMEMIEQMLVGGSFGKYINVEKAVQIGLLPDMPWENFKFLGNTSVRGAYYALLNQRQRERLTEIAARMTYVELSADNSFYEAFMSALFLPHTDMTMFPSVAEALEKSD